MITEKGICMKKVLITLLLLVSVTLMFSCVTEEETIVGTWKCQNNVLGVVTENVYVFNEDGTGTMSTVLDINLAMTYTVDETSLFITTSVIDIEHTTKYTYTLEDNQLTLKNDDETIVLKRVE